VCRVTRDLESARGTRKHENTDDPSHLIRTRGARDSGNLRQNVGGSNKTFVGA
jgi:hypothetical protein